MFSSLILDVTTLSLLALFFLMIPPTPRSTLFPYTTLFRSDSKQIGAPFNQIPLKICIIQAGSTIEGEMAMNEDFIDIFRSEEHTSELQSLTNLVCRLLLEKKKKTKLRII